MADAIVSCWLVSASGSLWLICCHSRLEMPFQLTHSSRHFLLVSAGCRFDERIPNNDPIGYEAAEQAMDSLTALCIVYALCLLAAIYVYRQVRPRIWILIDSCTLSATSPVYVIRAGYSSLRLHAVVNGSLVE